MSLAYRFHRLVFQREADRAAIKAAQERLAASAPDLERLTTAFEVYGFSLKDAKKTGVWRQIERTVGKDEYYAALNKALAEFGKPLFDPATRFKEEVEPPEPEPSAPPESTVSELVLRSLQRVPFSGRSAAEIRKEIEALRGTKLHEKTVGMTLYRLSREDPPKARRAGRQWFYVAQDGAMNASSNEGVFK